MKFNYQFSNLCGVVYNRGNLVFSPDGNMLYSAVGNRVTLFDLVNNTSRTLPFQVSRDIKGMALSGCGRKLLVFDDAGRVSLVGILKGAVLATMNMHGTVSCITFLPTLEVPGCESNPADFQESAATVVSTKFAICVDKSVQIWKFNLDSAANEISREFAPFTLEHKWVKHSDMITSVSASPDGRYILTSSKDLTCRIFRVPLENEICATKPTKEKWTPLFLSAQRSKPVNAFFHTNLDSSYSIFCVTRDGTLVHYSFLPKKRTVTLLQKHFFNSPSIKVKSCAYRKNLLVVGFVNGAFSIYQMPDFNLIHSLSIGRDVISTVCIGPKEEWLAFGSKTLGQLVVWEWQSETFVLKQQGHYAALNCLAYSPDGQFIGTGGEDGKVKIWSCQSGFCFATFSEHQGAISVVEFAKNGKILVSAALDGTVRAYDLLRYRNFKTMASPTPAQFSSMAVDSLGEIVLAGTFDTFEIFCWSLQTGSLLQIFSGHTGPISSLSLHPNGQHFCSASWDKTARIWDIYSTAKEMSVLTHSSDVLSVSFKPDGSQVAVSCLDGTINFWNPLTAVQVDYIEGSRDISGGRSSSDMIAAANKTAGKHFTSVCFSADGKNLIAAGNSKYICIYELENNTLVRKYTTSKNRKFGGVLEFLNSKNNKECGPMDLLDLDGSSADENERFIDKSLPGVKRGDLSLRNTPLQIRTKGCRFSPTGVSFSACTTEGLLVFSIDDSIYFDPLEIGLDITPENSVSQFKAGNYLTALLIAFKLNDVEFIDRTFWNLSCAAMNLAVKASKKTKKSMKNSDLAFLDLEKVQKFIVSICRSLPAAYYKQFMEAVARAHRVKPAIEIILLWKSAFLLHNKLHRVAQECLPPLRDWKKGLFSLYGDLEKICKQNEYLIDFYLHSSLN